MPDDDWHRRFGLRRRPTHKAVHTYDAGVGPPSPEARFKCGREAALYDDLPTAVWSVCAACMSCRQCVGLPVDD